MNPLYPPNPRSKLLVKLDCFEFSDIFLFSDQLMRNSARAMVKTATDFAAWDFKI